jgi:hypothetical protein
MSGGHLPQHSPQQHTHGVAKAQLPFAQTEAEIYPGPKGHQDEDPVKDLGEPAAGRPQKTVHNAQPRPYCQGQQKAPGRKGRGRHPSRRRSAPDLRGSS